MSKDLSALNSLLSASGKPVVEKCLTMAFVSRYDVNTTECCEYLKSTLQLSNLDTAEELRQAILECIEVVMLSGLGESLLELYNHRGQAVNAKLKTLVGQVITSKLDVWRESANANRVALPRLKDLAWDIRVVKKASSTGTGAPTSTSINVPVVCVNLTVEEQTMASSGPEESKVNFELSREALATMLDGFGRIKDQLAGSV